MSLDIEVTKQGIRDLDPDPVEDVVSEVRAYRLAIQGWAKGYAASRLLTPPCSEAANATAEADLRRWSGLYFAASRRSRRGAGTGADSLT